MSYTSKLEQREAEVRDLKEALAKLSEEKDRAFSMVRYLNEILTRAHRKVDIGRVALQEVARLCEHGTAGAVPTFIAQAALEKIGPAIPIKTAPRLDPPPI